MRAALLAVILGCIAAVAVTGPIRTEMADFEVYRTAGARAAAAEPLYRASDEHFQFKYFPAFAFVFAPLAALPMAAAKAVWAGLSAAALVAFLALSLRQLPSRAVPSPLIVLATLLTLGKFYAHELTLGQANLLLGLMAAAALAQLQHGREIVAGATFGAAAAVKPYAVVFLPYLVATRRFRAAAACAAVLLLALAVPSIQYGVQGNLDLLRDWWEAIGASTPANLTNQDNVSIAAMWAKWLGPGAGAESLALATSLMVVVACAAAILRRPPLARAARAGEAGPAGPEYLDVALLLTAVVLVSPQGWDYVLLLSTPAVMLIVNALPQVGRPLQAITVVCLALTGLTLYDVIGRAAYARFMALSVVTLAYGVLIGVLIYLRARRMA